MFLCIVEMLSDYTYRSSTKLPTERNKYLLESNYRWIFHCASIVSL